MLESEGGIVQRLDVKMKKTDKMVSCVLDEKTQQISATKIREQMRKDGKL